MPKRSDDEGLPEDPVFSNYSSSLWKSHSERRGKVDGGKLPVEPPLREQDAKSVEAAKPLTVAAGTALPSAKSEN
jgi:hypothetical protein